MPDIPSIPSIKLNKLIIHIINKKIIIFSNQSGIRLFKRMIFFKGGQKFKIIIVSVIWVISLSTIDICLLSLIKDKTVRISIEPINKKSVIGKKV